MKNRIDLSEYTANMARRFGSARFYYQRVVVTRSGERVAALFTPAQIDEAVHRAQLNPEDCPETRTFWQRLFRK